MLENITAPITVPWQLLHLQHPAWLILVIAPWLVSYVSRRYTASSTLERFIERPLWAYLLSGFHKKQTPSWLFITAWLFACIALASPTLEKSETNKQQKALTNIAIVLDISPSMRVQDVTPSRLEYSKHLLNELLTKLDHHRIALIAFSANAYVVSPLTSDKNIIRQQLNAMDPSLASVSGSNLARALELTTETLGNAAPGKLDAPSGIALLVSDGEIHDPFALQSSRFLGQSGHRLLTLGVGTEQGGPVPFSTGRLASENHAQNPTLVVSQRKQDNLRILASAGHGYYQDLHPDAWEKIVASSAELKQVQQEVINRSNGTPLFAWLLAPALALFVWLGIRKPTLFIIALALPLAGLNNNAEAASPINVFKEHTAQQHLNNANNETAIQLYSQVDSYTGKMGEGAAAYRQGDWSRALAAFEQAFSRAKNEQQKAHAAFNQGNTLIQLSLLDDAIQAYQKALFWQPSYAKANHNLTLLKRHQQAKGGEREGDSKQERRGAGGREDDEPQNNGARNRTTGQQHATHANERTGKGQQQQKEKREALNESLSHWQQSGENGEQPPTQTLQQLNNVKENHKTILKQRFESEDIQAAGLMSEKPW